MFRNILFYAVAGTLLLPSLALAAVPTDSSGTQANYAADVLDRFGINTHIDFQNYGYQNISQTAADINYLGNGQIKILRDSPGSSSDLTWWPQVSQATGAKFDAFIGEGGPGIYNTELPLMRQMKAAGNYIMGYEGGNEEDDSYPVGLGNSAQQAAQFQPQVWQAGQADGVPVFNISFGSGWCTANDPTCTHGDYNTVGDLSAYTDYANAHTYPQYSPQSTGAFAQLNTDANMAASTKPVAITEYGWTTNNPGSFGNVSEQTQAAYALEGILDGYLLGDSYYFYYGLYDDGAGTFGLFSTSNQPKPAAVAMHNFFTLLGDSGSNATSFGAGMLSYSLSGMPSDTGNSGGKQLLMQKSDGTYWLALWNEQSLNDSSGADVSVANVPVTLNLGATAQTINVYDPLIGTAPIATASNANSMQLSLPAHPILVEIVKSGSSTVTNPPPSNPPSSGGSTSSGSSSSNTGSTSGSDTPQVTAPASIQGTINTAMPVRGVSVSDPWASTNSGTMALNVSATGGTVTLSGATGSGTNYATMSGTLAQLNAALSTLQFTPTAASGSITINPWNQAGNNTSQVIQTTAGTTAVVPATTSSNTSTSPSTGSSSSTGQSCSANTTSSTPTTFDSEFNNFTMHQAWQQGDKWAYGASNSPDGRGGPNWGENGTQWWVNPLNPNTPMPELYNDSNGILNLGLESTPSQYQSYIDQQAGAHMPYSGILLNNQNTGLQLYGYYALKVAVDRVPGFTFQSDIEDVPIGPWPPEIDMMIFTDANGVQWVKFVVNTGSNGGPTYTISSNDGFDPSVQHVYSWNWESDYITFYIDGKQVFQTPTPQDGSYTNNQMFMYLTTYSNYTGLTPNPGTIDPDPANLPAYAHLDYIRQYASMPTDIGSSSGCSGSGSGSGSTGSGSSGNTGSGGTTSGSGSGSNTGSGSGSGGPTGLTSVYLTPDKTSVTSGSPVTLTWGAVGGTSCTGVNFTPNGPAGYVIVYPTQTTTYTVTCNSSIGTQSANATVTVNGSGGSSSSPGSGGSSSSPGSGGSGSSSSSGSSGGTSSSGSNSSSGSTGFTAGDSVITNASLNVRLGPGTNEPVICTQPPSAQGTLVGSPQNADGYTWWSVNYTSGCSGWSAQNYLTLTSNSGGSGSTSSGISVGGRVQTTSALNVRSSAGTSAIIQCTQATGAQGTVIGGPQSADGYTWWQISYDSGCSGWSVQRYLTSISGSQPTSGSGGSSSGSGGYSGGSAGNSGSSGSTGGNTGSGSTGNSGGTTSSGGNTGGSGNSSGNGSSGSGVAGTGTAFSVGHTVTAFDLLRVRSTPSLSGSILGTENGNAQGSIIGGPQSGDGYNWLDINWADGASGWSMQQYLVGGNITSSGGAIAQGNSGGSTGGSTGGNSGGSTSGGSSGGIAIGGRISATTNVSVVQNPGSSSGTGSESTGAQGTVINGPQNAGGVNWWEIIWDDGQRGWAPQNEITPATTVVTPPSTGGGSGSGSGSSGSGSGGTSNGGGAGAPPQPGTTAWYQNPGGDGLFWKLPFQTTASWITSGPIYDDLIGPGVRIRSGSDYVVPWVIGTASDPLVTVTDGTDTIHVHIPAGTVPEDANPPTDNSLGGADSTQPYLVWSCNNAYVDGSPSNAVQAGSTINCDGLLVADGTGPLMEDAVTGLPWQASDNALGASITDAELTRANADPNYVIPHMLQYSTDPSQVSANLPPAWPLETIDTSLGNTGIAPQGLTIGIPASTPRPTGMSRGFYLLFDNLQHYGWFFYNVNGGGNVEAEVGPVSPANEALAQDIQNSASEVWKYVAILNYDGSPGSQYGPSSAKGMINGQRSDAFPAPPPLDLSPTGGKHVMPDTFGAWYGTGGGFFYDQPGGSPGQ